MQSETTIQAFRPRAFQIPFIPLLISGPAIFFGEVACGTNTLFAALMAVSVFCAGLTYNLLGGLGTLGGMAFAMLALRSVVISQIAKIVLRQPADSPMSEPLLTASVYATFYGAALVGCFTFGRLRLPLPRPAEPQAESQSSVLYFVCLVLGTLGSVLFELSNITYGTAQYQLTQFNGYHSAGVFLETVLPLSIVLAVDERIRKTDGLHSMGWKVMLPISIMAAGGVVDSQREAVITPFLLYFLTAYFRGFRFRAKHHLAAVSAVVFFVAVLSPFEMYLRIFIQNRDLEERAAAALTVLTSTQFRELAESTSVSDLDPNEDYYVVPGTGVLSRLSRIRMDSNLIAGARSFHYGLRAATQDVLLQIPHFFYKDKPEYGSADYLGRVAGVLSDSNFQISEPAFTMIADSFGAFSFLGTIFIGLVVLPLTISAYESMFDISRPWGTVALITLVTAIAESTVGRLVANDLIRTPVYIIMASYALGVIVSVVPCRRQRRAYSY